MQGLIIFVVIVLISAGIGAVSQVLKNQQQAEQARAARARARTRNQRNERDDDRDERDESDGRRRDAVGARNQPSEIDRFLEEIERLRKKGTASGGQPVARSAQPKRPEPVPVARPARPVSPPPPAAKATRPADDRSFPEAKQKRQTNAQATEAKRRAETQAERHVPTSRKSSDAPPTSREPLGPLLPSSAGSTDPVTKGSLVGSEFAASKSGPQPTKFTYSVVALLKEKDSLAKAFILTEILGKPKSARR